MSIEAIRKAKEILERGGTFSTRCHQALEVLDKALAQINPDIGSGYAGVRIWIGDKTIQYSVTKVCIEQEITEDLAMKLAFDYCLKALKEKNT